MSIYSTSDGAIPAPPNKSRNGRDCESTMEKVRLTGSGGGHLSQHITNSVHHGPVEGAERIAQYLSPLSQGPLPCSQGANPSLQWRHSGQETPRVGIMSTRRPQAIALGHHIGFEFDLASIASIC